MNRRSFIALLGGTGATWPLSALGQAGAPVTIGLLSSSPEMAIQRRIAAFREGLQHSGYPLAQNVTLDIRRYIEGSGIAAELANRHVAAIFTMGNVAARAAKAFRQGLRETGRIEGQNVIIEYRWAEGQSQRLPSLAAELVNRRVAVLATGGGDLPAFAAKQATATIPIVFVTNDPVKTGLVASLNRPGANLTGVSVFTWDLGPKRLR